MSSYVLRGAIHVQTCLQHHPGSNYKQNITVCETGIEIFHQQKQLIFSNIQTCVIMLGKRNFIIYTEILVYKSMSMQCQGQAVSSTDTTCRNQTNTFDATVRLESLDAHISAIEKRLVFVAYFHLSGASLIYFHYSIDCLFDFGSKVASL